MNSDPGPLIRDTDYNSPTYGTMIGNPAYTGSPVTTAEGTTVYAGGGSTPPAPAPSSGAPDYLKNFSIWAAQNQGATQEQGQQAIDYFARSSGITPSSGGGYVAPSGYSGVSSLTSGTPTTSSPAGAFGSQNQITGNTSSTGNGGYMSRYGNTDFNNEAERYLSTFQAPRSEEDIYAEKTRQAQGRIDALNKYYESVMLDTSRENEARSAEQNALSVMSGLAGSSEASQYRMRTENINTQANAKVQAAKNLELQNIYKEIQADAYKQFQDERTNARQSALDVMDREAKREEKASNYIKTLASSGFDMDKIRTADPRTYKGLADAVGGEDMLKALFVLNKPKASIVDKKLENGRYIVVSQNPDGSFKTDVLDLGLPDEYDQTQDLGDQIMFYPKGDPTKAIYVDKGLSAKDQADIAQGWANVETNRLKVAADMAEKGINIDADGNVVSTKENDQAMETMSLVNQILTDPLMDQAFGFKNYATYWVPGSNEQKVKNRVDQLLGKLQLGERALLKGSGSVSDFESKTLAKAATELGTNLSPEDAKQALLNIRGALITSYGGTAFVKLTAPDGTSSIVESDSQKIADAIKDGISVEYVEQ